MNFHKASSIFRDSSQLSIYDEDRWITPETGWLLFPSKLNTILNYF